jgi:stalled ribosome rescue protein Dom34
MEVKTTQIRLIVEKIADLWIVTSVDEYGEVAIARMWDRDKAIERCKRKTKTLVEGPCEYVISEIDSSIE